MPQTQLSLLPQAVNAVLGICLQQVQLQAIVLGSIGQSWLAAVALPNTPIQLVLIPFAQVCSASVGGQAVSTTTLSPSTQPVSVPAGVRVGT